MGLTTEIREAVWSVPAFVKEMPFGTIRTAKLIRDIFLRIPKS
jgi:hypothetical protein